MTKKKNSVSCSDYEDELPESKRASKKQKKVNNATFNNSEYNSEFDPTYVADEESSSESESVEFSFGDEEGDKILKKLNLPFIDTPLDDDLIVSDSDIGGETRAPNKAVAKMSVKPFVRKWSKGDEIILLEALNECKTKNIQDYLSHISDVCVFDFEPSRSQLEGKIAKLKNNYKKKSQNRNHTPRDPHDAQVLDLSKSYWGDLGNECGSGVRRKKQNTAHTSPTCRAVGVDSFDVSAAKETLKEGFEFVREQQPWGSDDLRWVELRIEEHRLLLKKMDLLKEDINLSLKKLEAFVSDKKKDD